MTGTLRIRGAPADRFPATEIQAVVKRLDAIRWNAVHLDRISANLLRNGEYLIRQSGHQTVCEAVLTLTQDAHVAAAPDEFRTPEQLRNRPDPQIGALEERLNKRNVLFAQKAAKFGRSEQRFPSVGPPQREQIDRTRRRLVQDRTFGVDTECEHRHAIAVLGQQRGQLQCNPLAAPERTRKLIKRKHDVWGQRILARAA